MNKKIRKRIIAFLKRNKLVLLVLLSALIVRLIFFFDYHEIWWDSGVYVSMGKYLFSLGKAGLWEHIRPILWPFALGFLWFAKLSPVLIGRMLEIILSLGIVYMVYLIASVYFGKKSALIASLLVAFSSIFFYLGFRLYSEIPAIFLALLGIYFFAKERHYLAGLFVGLAFASKFPAGIFIVCLGISLLFLKPNLKKYAYLTAGFATVIIPYIVFNYSVSGAFIGSFFYASYVVKNVLGCNVLRHMPVHYYFFTILSDNFLHILSLAGFYFYFRRFDKKKMLPFLCLLLPFIYFTQLSCKDYRYFTLFMPFLAMFTGYGIYSLLERFFKKKGRKRIFVGILGIILIISVSLSVSFYLDHKKQHPTPAEDGYFRFLEGKEAEGEVWSSNPIIGVYTDIPVHKIYYPFYNGEIALSFYEYLQQSHENISYVFLDNCGGGIICAEEDRICKETHANIFLFLSEYDMQYDETWGRCYYRVYKLS